MRRTFLKPFVHLFVHHLLPPKTEALLTKYGLLLRRYMTDFPCHTHILKVTVLVFRVQSIERILVHYGILCLFKIIDHC